MRILIITPFPPEGIGGAETFVKELIKEASRKNEVTLCTLKIRHGKAWQGTSLKNFLSVMPKLSVKSLILLLRVRFDIIHAQGLISGLVAVILKKLFPVKVFITLLALYDFDGKGLVNNVARFVLNNCDIIFVEGMNGQKEAEGLIGRNIRIRTFNHWCDQEIFHPPTQRDAEKIRVLFVGRSIPQKGKHIIEGAERLLDPAKYEFTYVTDTAYENLPSLYQNAHIVVVPSLYSEGFSRVVCEAASCGCAVITSHMGSLPEMVNGWGVAIEPTAENFAETISEMSKEDLYAYQVHTWHWAMKYFSSKNSEVFTNEYNN